jgi:hypothetical protein
MQLLVHSDLQTKTLAADGYPPPKQTSNDERREKDLQIGIAPAKRASSAPRVRSECFLNQAGYSAVGHDTTKDQAQAR